MRQIYFRNLLRYFHNNFHNVNRVNWWQTLRFNFMLLPFKTACKLPFLLYGKCELGVLRGEVEFLHKPYKGMVKIGITDPFRSISTPSYISICGKMIVGKSVILRRGIRFSVIQLSNFLLNDCVTIGNNVNLYCAKEVVIGRATSVGNNTTIMDTDFHYVIKTATGLVKDNSLPIIIGDNNWIGGNCIIRKGTKTPKGTIVAGPYSMLSKDYTKLIPEYSLVAGSPAKLLMENVRRVNNYDSERIIADYFKEHNEPFAFSGDIDDFCLPKYTK